MVKKSPQFIPLLVYLLPMPVYALTPAQADYWTKSLVDYYPEDLRAGVLFLLPFASNWLTANCRSHLSYRSRPGPDCSCDPIYSHENLLSQYRYEFPGV